MLEMLISLAALADSPICAATDAAQLFCASGSALRDAQLFARFRQSPCFAYSRQLEAHFLVPRVEFNSSLESMKQLPTTSKFEIAYAEVRDSMEKSGPVCEELPCKPR